MQTQIIELTKLAAPKRAPFGEFLVQHDVIDRFQLFRSLQLQDRLPGARLGQCAVALGYAPREAVELAYVRYAERKRQVELETMATEAFDREWPIEIIPATS